MPKAICLTGWKYVINVLSTIRSADGFGFDEIVITGKEEPDVNLVKRLARRCLVDFAGGLRLTYTPDVDKAKSYLLDHGYTLVVMETDHGNNLDDFAWPENPAIVIGHEVTGVPMDKFGGELQVHVPMSRAAPSFNLACAASIAMYSLHLAELARPSTNGPSM
jgi:tRNA G18 (ribose-2'-O)-methylase SpoU